MSSGDNGVSVAVVEYHEQINPETGKLRITENRRGKVTVREVEPRSVQRDLEKLGLA